MPQLSKAQHRLTVTLLTLVACLALACGPATAEEMTEDEKTLYALGLAVSQNLASLELSEAELAQVQQGIADGALGAEPRVDLQVYGPKIQQLAQARMQAAAAKNQVEAEAFVAKKAAEEGATQTESGLVYKLISEGEGASPTASDKVTVHYHGTLADGTVFDSSVQRGEPAGFGLGQVVPCWIEGLQRMKVGGKAELTCPPDLAYGAQGRPPQIPPGSALVFEIELIAIGD